MDNNNHTPISISTNDTITIIWNGQSYTIKKGSPNYAAVKQNIKSGDTDSLSESLSVSRSFEKLSQGDVTVAGDKVLYKGQEIHNAAVTKLMDVINHHEHGYSDALDGCTDISSWMKFIDKLMQNPSYNSRNQLYKFLEHRNMPITPEGNVIGYKGVADDYKDIYSGKFDNRIGCINEMERSNVDDSVDHGCSAGFHIGSHEYADSWGANGRLMRVEFNPKDAVSVPHCSDYAKLRVCRYKVVGECFDRKPVDDGLYHEDSSNRKFGRKIMKYLVKRLNKGKDITTIGKLTRKFHNISVSDIYEAAGQDGTRINIGWSDAKNDYVIRLTG